MKTRKIVKLGNGANPGRAGGGATVTPGEWP